METKICNKCKRELDISCFHKRKRSRDGLCVWCKSCYKQWHKYYYKNHVEEKRRYGEQYRKNNIEKEIERHKKYYKNNVELRRVYNKNNENKIKKYNSEHCQESALFDLYYAQNKMLANDPDSCITLCKSCHKFVHSQEGCRYIDLTC